MQSHVAFRKHKLQSVPHLPSATKRSYTQPHGKHKYLWEPACEHTSINIHISKCVRNRDCSVTHTRLKLSIHSYNPTEPNTHTHTLLSMYTRASTGRRLGDSDWSGAGLSLTTHFSDRHCDSVLRSWRLVESFNSLYLVFLHGVFHIFFGFSVIVSYLAARVSACATVPLLCKAEAFRRCRLKCIRCAHVIHSHANPLEESSEWSRSENIVSLATTLGGCMKCTPVANRLLVKSHLVWRKVDIPQRCMDIRNRYRKTYFVCVLWSVWKSFPRGFSPKNKYRLNIRVYDVWCSTRIAFYECMPWECTNTSLRNSCHHITHRGSHKHLNAPTTPEPPSAVRGSMC